jgi:ribonuclease D
VDYRLDEYKIHVTDKDDCDSEHENIIALLDAMKEGKFIGLDCEWSQHPMQNKRLTLIQVASETVCVLLRCGQEHPMAEKVKASISILLGAANVIKYGVGLENDVAKLLEWEKIEVKNAHSIACMEKDTAIYGCKISPGMTHLVTHWLGEKATYKENETGMQFSDNVDPLSKDIKKYAALDAIVSYALGKKIHEDEDLSNSFMYAYNSGDDVHTA